MLGSNAEPFGEVRVLHGLDRVEMNGDRAITTSAGSAERSWII